MYDSETRPDAVIVDWSKCSEVGALLTRAVIPPPQEETDDLGLPKGDLPNFCFALVAICHQTSPLNGPRLGGRLSSGGIAFGWDYLRRRFAERVATGYDLLSVASWQAMTDERLDSAFEDADGRRTLTGTGGRTMLLRNLGEVCARERINGLTDLFDRSDRTIMSPTRSHDLMRDLTMFDACRDPVAKKSAFLLELARVECGWVYRDPENVPAPVDYHEVRGHLRIGTVVVQDEQLRDRLLRQELVSADDDIHIRTAVRDAIAEISRVHRSAAPSTLHYLFWNVFRSCCQRETVHCRQCGPACGLPARYRDALDPVEHDRCVFGSVCSSADRAVKVTEHQHLTDYY